MTKEIMKNIFLIEVPLPNNPLKSLNCYLIKGEDRNLLIDTGFRRDECRQALLKGLSELDSDPSRRDVLLTHMHTDHSGLAEELVGENRTVYMSGADIERLKDLTSNKEESTLRHRLLEEGFPRKELDESYAANSAQTMSPQRARYNFHNFCPLAHGDELQIGDYRLKTLLVPGHTPGNAMFWMEREQVMFTGDHVLFDVTPNIIAWPYVDDSLCNYLDNLRLTREYPVKLALPAHRKPGDYHARIDELLRHHEERIQEALKTIQNESMLDAYEIAGRMTWKIRADSWQTFPVMQKWFAVGECLSHLDYLRKRGMVRREKSGEHWRYIAL